MLKIIDNRITHKASFRSLAVGDYFEYLETYYIKTGLYDTEANAVDLKNGADDIVRLDAEVEPVEVELHINESEEF